ncbi:MAG TPA: dTDP-4-dehydrorhamnose 3,5-epimerase [Acidobacteriaceae bacterium]
MQIIDTPLRDVKLLRPRQFADERGWFAEVFNEKTFAGAGLPVRFVQDNQSLSKRGVLRGLHYQLEQQQAKLVRCLAGNIYDVAVDLRRDSPDFGRWAGFHLHCNDLEMLWIPEGFAHGFLVLSETASVAYKTTAGYYPAGERCIRWDDPKLAIAWPLDGLTPIIAPKDAAGKTFAEADLPPVTTAIVQP